MKKSIISLLLVACLLPCFISFAAANEGYALHTRNFIPEVIYAKLKLMPSADIVLLDKNPSVGSVDYVSWVSYDYLSELSLKWDTSGVIVYNSYMDAYFIRVSYVPTVSNNGEYEYCSLGTSNGFVLGSRNPNSSTTIDNSTTIGTVNLITNKYISTVVNSASKTASSVTNGLTNILSWLEVLSDGIELMIRHQDFTNDILYWIADEFYDMMHLIGEINLTIAEADIEQLKSLNRIDSVIRGISSNQVSLISALNTHLSSVSSQLTGIDTKLSSVIRNGQIQVNTSPIEARLDKLISMYSKVNSVVLDTASVNGGSITGAVGGELKDVVFWGDTSKVNDTFVSADGVAYTLNDTPVDINGLTLRSVNMGSTIPSYIANDPVLYAGVWRKGTDYIISDTYNASTGEYVQRVETFVINNETCTSQVFFERAGNVGFLGLYCPSLKFVYTDSPIQCSMLTTGTYDSSVHSWSSNTSVNADRYDGTIVPLDKGFLWGTTNPDAFGWLVSSSHAPCTIFYVPANGPFWGDPDAPVWSPTVQYFDPSTIAIPEGNSYISSYNVRITGKYETYDSYTQTADIISGIGRTEALLLSINTAVQDIKSYTSSIKTTTSTISTNVGKVNTALTSVIKDGKLKVDNSDIVTALAKLDNLPGIKTAVEGINTALTSVIADGQVKVDNSAVVGALAKLPNIDTSVASIKSYTSSIKTTTSTISTNVGKVNTALTSVIKDGKFKVDNSDIVTALGKLDKLAELPTIKTAVDGVNTTISSVISQGKLKVDNSAVVAAIEGIQAGSAADLSPVVVRMDAILAELQSAPGSAACEHTYTQHVEQEANCTLPGLLISTCSQCGDSYSEIVDPLGHDWIVTSHVDAVTDPETGEETASAYDVYTCSRCQRTYEDHDGSGPEEDYSSSSISKLVVKAFSRLGTFAGKLIGSVIHLFDKAITALDNVVSKFNEYVEQISGFGGGYPAWLTGFWGVLPAELQVALTFAVICMALGVVGKKLFFS